MSEDVLGTRIPVADHAFMVEDYDAVGGAGRHLLYYLSLRAQHVLAAYLTN